MGAAGEADKSYTAKLLAGGVAMWWALRGDPVALGTTLPYIFQNAPCEVIVVREPVATSEGIFVFRGSARVGDSVTVEVKKIDYDTQKAGMPKIATTPSL